MGEELPEVDPRPRIRITQDDLAPTAGPGVASRQPAPAMPGEPAPFGSALWNADTSAGTADGRPSETTRLMCAAAYMDGKFAEDVVDEIVYEHHRAVYIPTGVDGATVARHCLAALRQKLVRDGVLMAVLLLTIVLLFMKPSLGWLVLGYLLAWVVVLVDLWAATYYIVVKRLNRRDFPSQPLPEPSDPQVAHRIAELAYAQHGNLVAYSGFSPFSGAGEHRGGWSFLVDLTKGKQSMVGDMAVPSEPTTYELYNRVRGALEGLGIPNLQINDRLFVSGSDLREDRTLLPNPLAAPVPWVDEDTLSYFIATPTHRVRHYQCIEVTDWDGELVVSLFLRFWVGNERLFCELSNFVLFPLNDEFHRLDGLAGKIELRYVLSTALRYFFQTLGLWLRSPKIIFRPFRRSRERAATARLVEKDPFFDYGAPTTALDRARAPYHNRYFQRLDRERYDKTMERTVLDTIYAVLDEHDVDTGEFRERSAMIVNNSVIMNNSNINANGGSNVAIGAMPRIAQMVKPGASSGPAPAPPSS